MTALFSEVEKYEHDVKLARSLRRLCYVMTMLLSDGTYFDFFEEDIFDEKRQADFSEKNFFREHYNTLLGIFPRAREMFNKKEFLDE